MNKDLYRAKVLRKLKFAISDEEQYLERCSKRSSIFKVVGLALVVASIIESFNPGITSWVVLAQGIVGSILMSIGVVLTQSLREWPVLKQFIHQEKVMAEADG